MRTLQLTLDYGRYSETKPYIFHQAPSDACTHEHLAVIDLISRTQPRMDLGIDFGPVIRDGKTQVIALLLQAMARRSTSQRETSLARLVLWKAKYYGQCDMIKLVLEKFPRLHLDHAFELATSSGNDLVVNLLIDTAVKQGKRLFSTNRDESLQVKKTRILNNIPTRVIRSSAETEFIVACWSGNRERVKQLLRDGISADLEDDDGRTPLQIAVYCGHSDLVRLLLESGGPTNANYDLAQLAVTEGT
ncbi:hypothetical protein Aspvir_004884 [Aspergillus viridinutans]|uniref:Ankyrin n=1 Tax=Aspergillus viridinutans TaxID=75553 RepID=A0A9P3BR97_ASPVI|nr:uncharacterized protein Aspvir_004884 [Aspergillus viridinutans]GIK00855.1 hypothetical protein Aspvir_004884 [Aspergillus viridinutans]